LKANVKHMTWKFFYALCIFFKVKVTIFVFVRIVTQRDTEVHAVM